MEKEKTPHETPLKHQTSPASHWPKVMAASITELFFLSTSKPLFLVVFFNSPHQRHVLSVFSLFVFSRLGAPASGAGSPACSPRGGTCLCAWWGPASCTGWRGSTCTGRSGRSAWGAGVAPGRPCWWNSPRTPGTAGSPPGSGWGGFGLRLLLSRRRMRRRRRRRRRRVVVVVQ